MTRQAHSPKVADDFGETYIPRTRKSQQQKKHIIMGDKSPKSVNKKASQKQATANSANQAKKQAEVAKSAAGKKR